jgi:hypothetical protein
LKTSLGKSGLQRTRPADIFSKIKNGQSRANSVGFFGHPVLFTEIYAARRHPSQFGVADPIFKLVALFWAKFGSVNLAACGADFATIISHCHLSPPYQHGL